MLDKKNHFAKVRIYSPSRKGLTAVFVTSIKIFNIKKILHVTYCMLHTDTQADKKDTVCGQITLDIWMKITAHHSFHFERTRLL
jgi:hypothetical protein